jgi:hypothetical protein
LKIKDRGQGSPLSDTKERRKKMDDRSMEVMKCLEAGDEGDWAEHEGREVEVVNMIAGRYLLRSKTGEFVTVVNTVQEAMLFLKSGIVKINDKIYNDEEVEA